MQAHPSQLFKAPHSILTGTPLKELFNNHSTVLIGNSFSQLINSFDNQIFMSTATDQLESLTLLQRASHIAKALRAQLPKDSKKMAEILIQSLGPVLNQTENNGLKSFFYLPHSFLIHDHLIDDCDAGLQAAYELTSRFTSEFAIRPFILKYPDKVFPLLHTWTQDTNPHVRRLVSEGSRPRLPWAVRLPADQIRIRENVELLEKLKDDESQYVRRSVANHLGDIAKEHPEYILEICETWVKETSQLSAEQAKNRKWIIRHAIRFLAKKNHPHALDVRIRAK